MKCRSVLASLLAHFVALVAPLAALAELPPAWKSEAAYLESCIETLRRYHLEGARFEGPVLSGGAARGVAALLRGPRVGTLPAEDRARLADWLDRRSRDSAFGDVALLFDVLHQFSAEKGALPLDGLVEAAEAGIVAATGDPFTRIIGQETMNRLMKTMSGGEDRTYGFALGRKEGKLVVSHVRHASPAEEAGLEPGDELLALNGTAPAALPYDRLVRWLSDAGTGEKLALTVRRAGWSREAQVTLVQGPTVPPPPLAVLLPGRIGYLRFALFDMRVAGQVRDGVARLRGQGMAALVLDLRANPGGALPACVELVGMFLRGPQPVTRIESRHPMMGNRTFTSPGGPYTDFPLVVLTNHSSASASELLAGALKDHGRAVTVGEATFGKSVGQSMVPVRGKPGRFLYLTVLRYFLPHGGSVHGTGVVPDHPVKLPEVAGPVSEQVVRLRAEGAFDRYVAAHASAREALAEIAGWKKASAARYPGRETDLAALVSRLPEEVALAEVRRAARKRLAGALPLPPCDPERDTQFKKALEVAAARAGIALADVPEYR